MEDGRARLAVQARIPTEIVGKDREHLYMHLEYVFSGKKCSDWAFQRNWEDIIHAYDAQLERLLVMSDVELKKVL